MFRPIRSWVIFAIILHVIFIRSLYASSHYGNWYVFGTILAYAVLIVGFIIKSWHEVPNNHKWVIELFGKYNSTAKSGLNFIFPIFSSIASDNFLGEQLMELYLDERENETFGGGVVDFKDVSAPVEAKVFFKITDPVKATYKIDDLFQGIEEKLDSALRAYLANYTIEEAGSLKAQFQLSQILNGILVEKKKEDGNKIVFRDTDNEEVEIHSDKINYIHPTKGVQECQVYKEIKSWGVEIKSIIITDIILSPEIREARRTVLVAEQAEISAHHTKKATITLSEGEMQASINAATAEGKRFALHGTGMRNQLKKVVDAGLSESEASSHITKLRLYENLGDKTVVLETGGSTVGQGAQIGAGAAAVSAAVNNQNNATP